MGKPGVMFYFDIRPCIKRLTTEEKGQLFEAILDYGEFGSPPSFDDRLGIAWDFIQPKLDKDTALYGHKVAQRQYAVYVREARKRDNIPISFDEWSTLSDNEKSRLLSDGIGSYPTPTPASNSTPTPASASTDNIGAESRPTPTRQKYGSYGWVRLTEEEYTRLVADLGEAEALRCINYVDESAQSSGNKNRWKDWNLVVRKCHRDGWGLSKNTNTRGGTPLPTYEGAEQWSL